MPSLHEFATWEPLLRVLRTDCHEQWGGSAGVVSGQIGPRGWSLPVRMARPTPGRAAQVEDMADAFSAVERIQQALREEGWQHVALTAELTLAGPASIRVFAPSPAATAGTGTAAPGALLFVEGAVPEPWRRLPEPAPDARPAASADAELVERTLRERLPDAVPATEEEIVGAERRLGVTLPAELRAVYRVVRGRWTDFPDHDAAERVYEAVGVELLPPEELYVADAASRHWQWQHAATQAVVTAPDAAVQGLVGSPGWIAFGGNGGGDVYAVDLTPGPRGRTGQIVFIGHEESTGADLVADSLTDFVVHRRPSAHTAARVRADRTPAVARVNRVDLPDVAAAAHPDLEVLSIGVLEGPPLSLAPAVGLPKLRTLTAYPGTLADPLEISGLKGLEFLELGPEEWRVLLDAGAVPCGLAAAAIVAYGCELGETVALSNELLALSGRPQITDEVLHGDLGPLQ
ncbi:SMI1/KNR4 family protein [Streptomyces sp. NRRL F-5123]|uniref:SMI1/KNR4 family protein n=1 Tax=Streptomyces sp. NRRL F-5123 TaxID=1463856 RepID=UPI0004E28C58|nr:SMI1/KNR4 family protein [Streptomyces sp. NRRL F-5123]